MSKDKKPVKTVYNLDEDGFRKGPGQKLLDMIAKTPKEATTFSEEDRRFLNSTVGNEIIDD